MAAQPVIAQTEGSIITHNQYSPETLVKEIFAYGTCENIRNVTPIGNSAGIGYFENGIPSIGFDRGFLLATGQSNNARGPNNVTDKSGDLNDNNGDPDLNRLTSGRVYDATGVEFDFVPLDSFVTFRYVFASEEYCEFVGSPFNDVFGFFISGPGINGPFTNNAENVALVPGSDDYVAINSINYNSHNDWYIHNELEQDLNICELPVPNRPYLQYIQYDGFTHILSVNLYLQPCQTYHLRMVIGDVTDDFFDSAVFLEAGSFNIGENVTLNAMQTFGQPDTLYEGCNDAFLRFARSPESPADRPLGIFYRVGEGSEAEEGQDFAPLEGFVYLDAGEMFADVPFPVFADGQDETPERLRIVLDIPCACYSDTLEVFLADPPPLDVDLDDGYFCPGQSVTLEAAASGGLGTLLYLWQTGQTDSRINVQATDGTPFMVVVQDACAQTILDTAFVWATAPPSAFMDGEATICTGDTVWVPVEVQGVPPFRLDFQVDGGAVQSYDLSDSLRFPLYQEGYHTLVRVTDAACSNTAEGGADVVLWELNVNATIGPPSCFGSQDGRIALQLPNDFPPYLFRWAHTDAQTLVLAGLAAGSYDFWASDARGCTSRRTLTLVEPAPLLPPTAICERTPQDQLTLQASGGTPPYQYAVGGGTWLPVIDNNLTPGQAYNLAVQDARNCMLDTLWYAPLSWQVALPELAGRFEYALRPQTDTVMQLPGAWPLSYFDTLLWWPADQLSCSNCTAPTLTARQNQTGWLWLTDVYGCRDSVAWKLEIKEVLDVYTPSAFSPNRDGINDRWFVMANPEQIASIDEVHIYDRWGSPIFAVKSVPLQDESWGWNGEINGQPAAQGVYAYYLIVTLQDGKTSIVTGDILLLR